MLRPRVSCITQRKNMAGKIGTNFVNSSKINVTVKEWMRKSDSRAVRRCSRKWEKGHSRLLMRKCASFTATINRHARTHAGRHAWHACYNVRVSSEEFCCRVVNRRGRITAEISCGAGETRSEIRGLRNCSCNHCNLPHRTR